MAGIDFTVVADILTKDIHPEIPTQMYRKAPMWATFGGFQPKSDGSAGEWYASRINGDAVRGYDFQNNTIYTTILLGNMETSGVNVSESATYGTLNLGQGSLGITTQMGAFLIPKQVLNIKSAGAIAQTLTLSTSQSADSMAMDLNRQAYSDGTATLAYADGSGTSTKTINLKPKATASTLYNNDIDLARYFPLNRWIKVGNNAVTQVTGQTGTETITVADNQTFSANDAILHYTQSGTLSTELTGLASMVGAGVYQGIDPASTYQWQAAKVDTNAGAARTMANTIKAIRQAYTATTTVGKPKLLMMNVSSFDNYGATLTDQVRFSAREMFTDGWVGLDYMGGNATILLDADCPDDRVYILSPDFMYQAEYQPFEFEQGTQGLGLRVQQKIDFEVLGDWMGNVGTTKRRAHSVLTNIVG